MNLWRFKIGDVVEVKATTEAAYDSITKNERKLFQTELEEPKLGQVVGLKRLYLGKYQGSARSEHPWDVSDQPYLQVEKAVTVLLVDTLREQHTSESRRLKRRTKWKD